MTSFNNSSSFDQEGQNHNQAANGRITCASETQRVDVQTVSVSNKESIDKVQDTQNSKRRKSKDICGVHSTSLSDKNNSREDVRLKSLKSNQCTPGDDNDSSVKESKCSQILPDQPTDKEEFKALNGDNQTNSLSAIQNTPETKACDKVLESEQESINLSEHSEDLLLNSAKVANQEGSLNPDQERDLNVDAGSLSTFKPPIPMNNLHGKEKDTTSNSEVSQSTLPDILRTLHNKVPYYAKTTSPDGPTDHDNQVSTRKYQATNETISKSKAILSQTSYIPHSLTTDVLNQDAEVELKHFAKLQNLKTNQSIYKLAYDENTTDQSESDSRSPSPIDPETQVPRSLTNAEILIHEADSTSEAGSEDVELIPHRYESETFLNENKHVYVNKLSLAVELLRTQENLPYDDQFKRVVGEDKGALTNAKGEVNFGFVEESSALGQRVEDMGTYVSRPFHKAVITTLPQSSEPVRNNLLLTHDFQELCNDSCEEAKEVDIETSSNQDNTEEVRAGYRRMQVQFRHYFTPRAALVNPCLCCNIM